MLPLPRHPFADVVLSRGGELSLNELSHSYPPYIEILANLMLQNIQTTR